MASQENYLVVVALAKRQGYTRWNRAMMDAITDLIVSLNKGRSVDPTTALLVFDAVAEIQLATEN